MRGLICALLLALPLTAAACWNEVRLSTQKEAKALSNAEGVLRAGNPKLALKRLRTLYGKRAIMHPERAAGDPDLGRKARALLAIAILRAKTIDPKTGRGATQSRQRQLQRLAIDTLTRLRRDMDHPLLRARHAEGLARDPKTVDTARALLEALASDDLISEPEAWVTLAALRRRAKDSAGSAAALKRCTALGDAARCVLPPAGGS